MLVCSHTPRILTVCEVESDQYHFFETDTDIIGRYLTSNIHR